MAFLLNNFLFNNFLLNIFYKEPDKTSIDEFNALFHFKNKKEKFIAYSLLRRFFFARRKFISCISFINKYDAIHECCERCSKNGEERIYGCQEKTLIEKIGVSNYYNLRADLIYFYYYYLMISQLRSMLEKENPNLAKKIIEHYKIQMIEDEKQSIIENFLWFPNINAIQLLKKI